MSIYRVRPYRNGYILERKGLFFWAKYATYNKFVLGTDFVRIFRDKQEALNLAWNLYNDEIKYKDDPIIYIPGNNTQDLG